MERQWNGHITSTARGINVTHYRYIAVTFPLHTSTARGICRAFPALAFLPLPAWRGACPSAPSRCCVLLIAASLRPGVGVGEAEGWSEG